MSKKLSKILVVAPHLKYPITNGGDLGIWGRALALSYLRTTVIIGENQKISISKEQIVSIESFENKSRSKNIAALKAIYKRSHYLLEKFITPSYIKEINKFTKENKIHLVWYSHIWSSILKIESDNTLQIIETHNDDFKWFKSLSENSRNILLKKTAKVSYKWTLSFLNKHENNNELKLYIHVTEKDMEGYLAILGKLPSFVLPAVIQVNPKESNFIAMPPTDKVNLVFCASLSVKMNHDALIFFSEYFYPVLLKSLQTQLSVTILGSNPTPQVEAIIQKHNWSLYKNLSEDDLNSKLKEATFSILPFAYATGTKMKRIKSLSLGVPILSNFEDNPTELPHCLSSDNPNDWTKQILQTLKSGITLEERQKLQNSIADISPLRISDKIKNIFEKYQ